MAIIPGLSKSSKKLNIFNYSSKPKYLLHFFAKVLQLDDILHLWPSEGTGTSRTRGKFFTLYLGLVPIASVQRQETTWHYNLGCCGSVALVVGWHGCCADAPRAPVVPTVVVQGNEMQRVFSSRCIAWTCSDSSRSFTQIHLCDRRRRL